MEESVKSANNIRATGDVLHEVRETGRTEVSDCAVGHDGDMQRDFLGMIKQQFHCKEQDIRAYSPLTLAYMGDAIYELVIRTVIVERANRSANDLHKKATRYVKAETQARIITALVGEIGEEGVGSELTEDEKAVYKRGRNAKSYTTAKNATMADYRKATGFEALMGFLYLTGQTDRLLYLVKRGIELAGLEI